MKLFRITSSEHPPFDGTGSFLNGGRWNNPGKWVIYCSENLSCCRLEMLVHIGTMRLRPTHHVFVEIEAPDALWQQAETRVESAQGLGSP